MGSAVTTCPYPHAAHIHCVSKATWRLCGWTWLHRARHRSTWGSDDAARLDRLQYERDLMYDCSVPDFMRVSQCRSHTMVASGCVISQRHPLATLPSSLRRTLTGSPTLLALWTENASSLADLP